MTSHDTHEQPSFWKSRTGIALCAFVAIAAVLLILEDRAHALQWLPIAILLACPLLHLFHGHGGHRGHGPHGASKPDKTERDGP